MLAKLKFISIFLLIFLSISLFMSRNSTPDSQLLFGIKRLQENLFIKLKPQPQKIDYESQLLDTRLKELKTLVENKQYDYILTSSSRYSASAGDLVNSLNSGNFQDKVSSIKLQFNSHQAILNGILNLCRQNDNTECKYIQDDVNYLRLYLNQLAKT